MGGFAEAREVFGGFGANLFEISKSAEGAEFLKTEVRHRCKLPANVDMIRQIADI